MNDRADGAALASRAAAFADTSRATMLLGMLDGRAWTATELAAHAGISRSTATEHLHVLRGADLVEDRHQGRHRYVRIRNEHAAHLVEMLAALGPPASPQPSWRAIDADRALAFARTCYDHLAGNLGVRVREAFEERGLIDAGAPTRLTAAGEAWCTAFGIDLAALRRSSRPEIVLCLDWTERRDHLAGGLGAAVLARCIERGWMARSPGSRAVRLTEEGRRGLASTLGIPESDVLNYSKQPVG